MNNYFKSGGLIIGFDQHNEASIRKAWLDANGVGDEISAYRPFRTEGPWSGCDLVGFTETRTARKNVESDKKEVRTEAIDTIELVEQQWNYQ